MIMERRSATHGGDASLNVRQMVQACRRQSLLSLGIPALLLASTAVFLWWSAPVYQAVTTIRIDQERSGVAIIEALRNLSSGSKITTEMEELRSRTLAEAVVDSLGLNVTMRRPRKVARSAVFDQFQAARQAPERRYVLERAGPESYRLSGADGPARSVAVGDIIELPGIAFMLGAGALEHDRIVLDVEPFGDAVRRFQARLSIARPNREADFVRVAYQGGDAPLVQAVPDLIASMFMARRNTVRTQEARSTGEFLATQIAALHGQLTTTEDELRAFQERYGVLGIEAQSEAAVRRLAEMQADRERLDIERQAVANVLETLGSAPDDPLEPSGFRALLGLPSILTNAAAAELVNALNQAETSRALLLDRRTVEDPEVQWATYRIRQIEEQLSTITRTYLGGLTEHVRGLDRTLAGFSAQLAQIPEQELHLARLRRQAGVTEELYTTLSLRLKEAEIMAAIDDPTVRIIDPAVHPRRPIRPNVPLTVALAMLAGMVLGVGSAVAREQMDDTVHSRDELQFAGRVPVLGAIPRLGVAPENGRRFRFSPRPVPAGNGQAGVRLMDSIAVPGVGEAYRSLRTNITFAQLDRKPRVLVVTSPAPGDGKSTTAANLAITMAQQGLRCLLIDGDMRRGRLHETFGARREPGLSNVLLGQVTLDAALRADTGGAERPSLLSTGTVPPNPAELLGSDQMGELLAVALEGFDLVVIDAPPLNMVTDAAVLSKHADGVLVVARAGVTQQTALAYTFEQLAAVNAPVLGSILNDADPQRERHYGSYMRGYYEPNA